MTERLSSIIKKIPTMKKKTDRIEYLKQFAGDNGLLNFLNLVYNPKIVWTLPNFPIPKDMVKKSDEFSPSLFVNALRRNMRKLEYATNLKEINSALKREQIYLELLSELDSEDIEMIEYVRINRDFPQKAVTKALFQEAFPQFQNWDE